jgi:predicted nucleotidyltransferase
MAALNTEFVRRCIHTLRLANAALEAHSAAPDMYDIYRAACVKARVYGSRVTGKAHDASDLDVALISPDARDWAHLPKRFHAQIEQSFVDL